MSSMAKIFVVVNLVLVVAAFGSAATLLGAVDEYRTAFEDVTQKFDEYKAAKEKEVTDLENSLRQQQNKAVEEYARANQLGGERDDLKTRLAAAANANETLRSTVDSLTKDVQAANAINDKNQKWLDSLSKEVTKATQEMLNATKGLEEERSNRGQLEQQVELLNDQVQEVSVKLGDAERQARELQFWVDEYKKRFGDITGLAKGAPGVVNAVKGNLVSISVGSADGVRQGDRYSLSRGGTFVGTITITRVEKNQAVGTFDVNWPGPGAPAQSGDAARPASNW